MCPHMHKAPLILAIRYMYKLKWKIQIFKERYYSAKKVCERRSHRTTPLGEKQPKQVGKMPEIRKKLNLEVMTTFFWKISSKSTNFEDWCLGRGIFDEVSVWKVTVSTTSVILSHWPILTFLHSFRHERMLVLRTLGLV